MAVFLIDFLGVGTECVVTGALSLGPVLGNCSSLGTVTRSEREVWNQIVIVVYVDLIPKEGDVVQVTTSLAYRTQLEQHLHTGPPSPLSGYSQGTRDKAAPLQGRHGVSHLRSHSSFPF